MPGTMTQGWPTWLPRAFYRLALLQTDQLHCGVSTSGGLFGLSVKLAGSQAWLPVSAPTPADRSQAHTDWSAIQTVLRGYDSEYSGPLPWHPVQENGGELVQVAGGYWELRPPEPSRVAVQPGRVEVTSQHFNANRDIGYLWGPLVESTAVVTWTQNRISRAVTWRRTDRRQSWSCNSYAVFSGGWYIPNISAIAVGSESWTVSALPIASGQSSQIHHVSAERSFRLVLANGQTLVCGWEALASGEALFKFWRHSSDMLYVTCIESGPALSIGSPVLIASYIEVI